MKIYLITNGENQYKIGFTSRKIGKRINELQTGTHTDLFTVKEYESENARQIETILHRFYSHNKIKREWFEMSNSEVEDFIKTCSKIDYNLKFLNEHKI